MVWSPPGSPAPTDRWRYDLGKKAFAPPGEVSPIGNTQVAMPESFSRDNGSGFHLLTSPPGNQAPPEHINYTPETGEIHGRGQPAPKDKLNYSLIPETALHTQGAGHTSGGGRGGGGIGGGGGAGQESMGAGANIPVPQRQPFAGTPPMSGGPSMTGPSPTLNRAQPAWGGGGTSMNQRMGMGQSDGSDDGTDLFADTSTSDGSADASADSSPAPATQTQTSSSSGPPTVQGVQGIPVYGEDGKTVVGYQVPDQPKFQGQDPKDWPKKYIIAPQTKATQTSHSNPDGSIDIIQFTPGQDAKVQHIPSPDPDTAKAIRDKDAAAARASDAQATLDGANTALTNAKTSTERATAQTAVAKAQADLITAQNAALKAASDAQTSQQKLTQGEGPQAPTGNVIDADGNVYVWDATAKTLVPTGVKSSTAANAEIVTAGDGSMHLVDKATKKSWLVAPPDPYKQYPPTRTDDGRWIMWDPNYTNPATPGVKGGYNVVYTEDSTKTTTWRDGKLISTDPHTGETKVVYDAGPSMAEGDAHTTAIDNHNQASLNLAKTKQDLQNGRITMAQARVTMEGDLQKLLHPQPFEVGHMIFAPPGQDLNLQTYNPQTKQLGSETVSGGPPDPNVQSTADQIRKQLSDISYGAQPTDQPTTPGNQTQPQQAPAPDPSASNYNPQASTAALNAQGFRDTPADRSRAIASGQAGLLATPTPAAQTQTNQQSSGDIVTQGVEGSTALDPRESVSHGGDQGELHAGDQDRGVMDPADFGGGHEMGAGATGTPGGWVPRPAPFSRAAGPGWLGGSMGTGQEAPTQTPPQGLPSPAPPNQGEAPPPGPMINTGPGTLPGPMINTGAGPWSQGQTTDKNVNWVPNVQDVVTQKVNEKLKDLLGWPKYGDPEHEMSGDPANQQGVKGQFGLQGGFDQPQVVPVDLRTGEQAPAQDPNDLFQPKSIRDLIHVDPAMTPGTEPEDIEETQSSNDPEVQQHLDTIRKQLGTTGSGQGQPQPNTNLPSVPSGAGPGPQPPPPTDPRAALQQQQGKQALPKWMQILLRKHPELLQMAGGSGGGAPVPPPSTPAGPMASGGASPAPPMGGGQDQPPAGPGAPPPQAPGPGGAPMQPPVQPQNVAGIGHRFGQQMDVGEPQHSGVDLQAPEGTPTTAPVDGFVSDVNNDPQGLGLTVVIRGSDGSEHKLGHLSKTTAYRGMQVARGQDLGSAVGESGLTTGAHLHWGVKDQQGQPVDPTQALGPMAGMPPVPGTEQMGPPGGTGASGTPPPPGGPPPPTPPMGGGQQAVKPQPAGWHAKKPRARRRWGKPDPSQTGAGQGSPTGQPMNTESPDYQAGYQAGMQANQSPGTPPMFVPSQAQPIPGAQDMSGGFSGDASQGMGGGQDLTPQQLAEAGASGASPTQQYTPQQLAALGASGASPAAQMTPQMTPQQLAELGASGASPNAQMGGGQDTADSLWDKYEAREVAGAMGAGANPNPLEMQWIHHNPTELPRDDPLLRPGGSSSTSKAAGLWGADPMQGLKQLGQVDIDPGEAFGSGQMGAGGVYVQSPDGSMHWDETKPDPSDSGGSVISSTTGAVIPGANRQSGPTGPGGTGPPGSQARQAHVTELTNNPSFISSGGGSIFPGGQGGLLGSSRQSAIDAALWSGGSSPSTVGGQMAQGSSALPPGATANVLPTSGSSKPHAVAGELDPTTFKTYGVSPNWPGFTGFAGNGNVGAGAEGGMGAGDTPAPNPTQSGVIDPYDMASLVNSAAQIQVNNNAETDRHQEALLQMAQDWSIHQDDLAYQQSVQAETVRHNQVTEQLTSQQQTLDAQLGQLDNQTKLNVQQMANQSAQQIEQMKEASSVQLAQMQEGTQIYMQQGSQAFQDWQTRQQNYMTILSSALSNPWMQQLTGMTPPGGAGTPMGASNIANLVSQVLQPYDVSQFSAANAPAASNLGGAAQGPTAPALPATPTAGLANAQGSLMPGTTVGGMTGTATAPAGQAVAGSTQGSTATTQATPGQGTNPYTPTGTAGANVVAPDTTLPTWQQWQSWSPWQKAAYRTNIEAIGPGAWDQQQAAMQASFGSQGGSADVTQMAAAAASPTDQIGQQMTAEAFGQTPSQWQTNQTKQWSAAAAPSVKQNISTSQGGAASSGATPESQYGL